MPKVSVIVPVYNAEKSDKAVALHDVRIQMRAPHGVHRAVSIGEMQLPILLDHRLHDRVMRHGCNGQS